MNVKELIAALSLVNQDLPVVTFANNHSYHSERDNQSHGGLVVGIYHRGYSGETTSDGIIIGNVGDKRFNYPNDWMGEIIVQEERRYH